MFINENNLITPAEKNSRDNTLAFYQNMHTLLPYLQLFDPTYTEDKISKLKPFAVENYTDEGSYGALRIHPEAYEIENEVNSFYEYNHIPNNMTWEELTVKLNTAASQLEEQMLPLETFFAKHYILTNATIHYIITDEPYFDVELPPLDVCDQYYELLKLAEHLSPIKTRLAADFIFTHSFAPDEAVAAVEMPALWLQTLYGDLYTAE